MADGSAVPKQKPKRKPTTRMKRLAGALVENGGHSVSDTMRLVGYSPATAKTPSKVTRSEAFQQLLHDMGVSDERLAQVLNDGLDANREFVLGEELMSSPDYATRHKYLETGLRLRGLGKADPQISISFNNLVAEQRERYGI